MPLWSRSLKKGFLSARAALPLMLLPFAVDAILLLLDPGLVPENPSVEFALPLPFPSLAQVMGQSWGNVPFLPLYPPWQLGPFTTPVILAYLGIISFVTAGYIGALEGIRVEGSVRSFLRKAAILFSRIFAYNALVAVIVLVQVPFLMGYPAGLLVSLFVLAALIVIFYFIFLIPFVITVDDRALGFAVRRSLELAYRGWREIVPYCLAYAGITAAASGAVLLLLTLLPSLLGALLAVGLYGALGTALVMSTLYLYEGLSPVEPLPAKAPAPKPAEEAAPS